MFKNKKLLIIYIIMCAIFAITFSIGIFGNPNFNIYDFCMNMSSEILGIVIAVCLIDVYINEKNKNKKDQE